MGKLWNASFVNFTLNEEKLFLSHFYGFTFSLCSFPRLSFVPKVIFLVCRICVLLYPFCAIHCSTHIRLGFESCWFCFFSRPFCYYFTPFIFHLLHSFFLNPFCISIIVVHKIILYLIFNIFYNFIRIMNTF